MPWLPLFCRFWMHMMKSFLNKVFAVKKQKETFLLSRFSLTKSAAKVSKEDLRRPPSEPLAACTSWSREPCVASVCGKCQSESR